MILIALKLKINPVENKTRYNIRESVGLKFIHVNFTTPAVLEQYFSKQSGSFRSLIYMEFCQKRVLTPLLPTNNSRKVNTSPAEKREEKPNDIVTDKTKRTNHNKSNKPTDRFCLFFEM